MAITFSQPTDGGSVDVANCSDDGSTYTVIKPRTFVLDNADDALGFGDVSGRWSWCFVQMDGCNGLTRTIRVAREGKFPNSGPLQTWVYSENGGSTWTKFGSAAIVGSNFEYAKGSAWAADTVLVAAATPYSVGRLTTWIDSIKTNAKVYPTVSGDSDLLVAMTGGTAEFGHTDTLDRTVTSQPYYGFRVGNSSLLKPYALVLTGRTHPGESTSSFMVQQIVAWLIGGSTEANDLLKKVDVYVYPMLDPEGVYYGYFRSSPVNESRNTNRMWSASRDGDVPTMDKLKSVWDADLTANGIKIVGWFDCHYKAFTGDDAYFYDLTREYRESTARAYTFNMVNDYSPLTVFEDFNGYDGNEDWMAAAGQGRWGAQIGITIENNHEMLESDVTTYRDSVVVGLKALVDHWVPSCTTTMAQLIDATEPTYYHRLADSRYMMRGPRSGTLNGGENKVATLTPDIGTDGAFGCDNTNSYQVGASFKTAYSSSGCTLFYLCTFTQTANNLAMYLVGEGNSLATANSLNFGLTGTLATNYPGLFFSIKDGANSGPNVSGGSQITDYDDDNIHSVVIQWETNHVVLWWDGEIVYEYTGTFNAANFSPPGIHHIGCRSDGLAARVWPGTIDEYIRYDRFMSADEVADTLELLRTGTAATGESSSAGGTGPLGWLPY